MDAVKIFEDRKVRSHYDSDNEIWYFSIVDIVEALTDSKNPTDYLKKIRKRDVELGSYIGTNCPQITMLANGKKRKTLAGNVEHILRLVQSIPSPKAEPFKQWLAKVGYERIQEIQDPSQSVDRARENWKEHGRSEKWIQQRMMGQETRNKLTDYWKEAGIEEKKEFAILTNIIHQEWTGLSVKKHKEVKGLKSQNLRDHMSEAELIFTALAELSTRQIAENDEAKGLL
ncbi:BRO family protein [Flavobacterium gyeonganense]|uniref:BRO family protein n=1 Tax=Flavobacterium gyeonganense TaxID=1310418 RepID=A0ABV5H7J9_9FLAO|nr:BRO family protein [Flavobacterium gyeonganense]